MKTYNVWMLGLVLLAAPAFGATVSLDRENAFKLELGPVIPVNGDLDDVSGTGYMFAGQWIHRMSPEFGAGAELSFTSFGDKSYQDLTANVDMTALTAVGRYDLRQTGANSPYFIGGLGVTKTRLDFNTNSGRNSSSNSDTSPSLLVGGGMDFVLERIAVGLGVRYAHTFFDIANVNGGGALQILGQVRW